MTDPQPPAVAAPRVTVIILTWNRVDDIVTCLESFAEVDYPNLEVMVVDNASADNTVETVRARYPWTTLIVNDDNLGYVGGNNVGIRYALAHGTDYVFVLNSDTKMTPSLPPRAGAHHAERPAHRHRRRQEPLHAEPRPTPGASTACSTGGRCWCTRTAAS